MIGKVVSNSRKVGFCVAPAKLIARRCRSRPGDGGDASNVDVDDGRDRRRPGSGVGGAGWAEINPHYDAMIGRPTIGASINVKPSFAPLRIRSPVVNNATPRHGVDSSIPLVFVATESRVVPRPIPDLKRIAQFHTQQRAGIAKSATLHHYGWCVCFYFAPWFLY